MKAEQIVFPFRTRQKKRATPGNSLVRLVGRSYFEDDYVEVTVIGVCGADSERVLMRRCPGTIVSMPGWLVCLIFSEEDKKARQVA